MFNHKKYLPVMSTALALCLSVQMTALAQDGPEKITVPYEQENAWEEIAIVDDAKVETGVYVRAGASKESPVIGSLYKGGAAWVLKKGPEWTEICSGDLTGFVKNEYLLYGMDAEGRAMEHGIEGVKTTWDDVKMFADLDKDSEIIKSISYGDSYILLEAGSHWIQVQNGADSKAYVSADDVARVLLLDTAVPRENTYHQPAPVVHQAEQVPAENTQTYETEYQAPVENTQTYETEHQAPVENTQTYETEYQPPVENTQTYETEYQAPVENTQTYETEYQAPVENTETYDTDYQVPTDNQSDGEEYYEFEDTSDSVNDSPDGEYVINDDSEEYYDADSEQSNNSEDVEIEYNQDYSEEYYDADTIEQDESFDDGEGYYDADTEYYVSEGDCVEEPSEGYSTGSDDLSLLGALIYCEAGNQSYEGMVAVGAVVMNRVYSASFPNTVSDVIYQGGQFTPASSGALASALENGVPSTCYDAAAAALGGDNPVGSALYFNAGSGNGTQIGDHQFY